MRIAVCMTLFVVACGTAVDTPKQHGTAVDLTKARAMMPTCNVGNVRVMVFNDAYLQADGARCHSPNGGLYHGLLCLSGEKWACDAMRLFIHDDSLVKDPLNLSAQHGGSGSRDELVGHLAYLAKTGDRAHADKLLRVIDHNSNRVCDDDVDGRCTVTPAMWGLARVVWRHHGWTPTARMLVSNIGDDHALLASAATAQAGYQLHLIAAELLIRRHTRSWSMTLTSVTRTLAARSSSNLLFQWLNGADVSGELQRAIDGLTPGVVSEWPWSNPSVSPHDHPAGYVVLGNLVNGG